RASMHKDGVVATIARHPSTFATRTIALSPQLWNSWLAMGRAIRSRCSVALLWVVGTTLPSLARGQDVLPTCEPDQVGCHSADVDFHHEDVLFDGIMLDSGWVPSGSPLQVRFAVFAGGSTVVDLGGTAMTSWPAALEVAVPGRAG